MDIVKGSEYRKGKITFARTTTGKLVRVDKPTNQIQLGATKSKSGGTKFIKPVSTTVINRGGKKVVQTKFKVGDKTIFSENGRVVFAKKKIRGSGGGISLSQRYRYQTVNVPVSQFEKDYIARSNALAQQRLRSKVIGSGKVTKPQLTTSKQFTTISPNMLTATNYRGLGRFGANLAKKGFTVPSEIVFGFQASGKEWKSMLVGFTAGAGLQTLSNLKGKGIASKIKILGKTAGKLAGTVAIPLLLFDAGTQYRKLKAEGNSDAFALTKVIATLGGIVGGAGVGAKTAQIATSSATRKAISLSAKKTFGDIKKPTRQTYKKITTFLESVNPLRPYNELVLQPSNVKGRRFIKRVDPKTKQEIKTIISKLESIVKFGNQHISVIKRAPGIRKNIRVGVKTRIAPLPKDLSLVPVTSKEINSGVNIAKSYLTAYKRMLAVNKPKPFKISFAGSQKEYRKLLSDVARNKKLAKGLQVKQRPGATIKKTRLGNERVYQFKELITGKTLNFKNRKSFLKAIKEQEKLIRSGAINVKTSKFSDWFKAVNNQLTNAEGKELKIIISKAVNKKTTFRPANKRIFTLQDVAKKTAVKKTSSGGVEVKTAKGQVLVLETPKTIVKNKPALKQLQQQQKMPLQKTKTLKKRVVLVKNQQVIKNVVSTGNKFARISKLTTATALSRAFSRLNKQEKGIARIFANAQLPAQDQAKIIKTKPAKAIIKKTTVKKITRPKKRIVQTTSKRLEIAKKALGKRTLTKLKAIKAVSLKRKKVKFTKEEIKYMLSKVYAEGKYRPSLAAIIFNITAFKAPTKLTGFELRPIIKQRRK